MKKREKRAHPTQFPEKSQRAPNPLHAVIFSGAALIAAILFAFFGVSCYQWLAPPVPHFLLFFSIFALIGHAVQSLGVYKGIRIKTGNFGGKYAEYILLLAIFSTAILLKTVGIHESGTDENIYYYGAVLMSQGVLPYRDFFFAHPPVHLVVPAVVFALFQFNIVVAKMIPLAAFLLSGAFLYLTVREKAGWIKAILALAAFFSCYEVLMASTDMTGINLTTMFCMISLYMFVRKSYLASGILSGVALMTGLYSAAFVLALSLFALFILRRSLLSFLAGLAGAFFAIFMISLFVGGEGFLEGVFEYHMKKPLKQGGQMPLFSPPTLAQFIKGLANNIAVFTASKKFTNSLYFHTPYYLAAAISFFTVLAASTFKSIRGLNPLKIAESPYFTEKFAILCTLLFIVQFSLLREVYDFYLTIMMPFLSILLGSVLYQIYDSTITIARSLRGEDDPTTIRSKATLLVLSLLIFLWLPLASRLNATFPEEVSGLGEKVDYRWKNAAYPEFLSPLVKYLYFADSRIRGEVEPFWRHYVWNKSLFFSKAKEIAAYIKEKSDENETITGASTLAPLIALYADRRLAANEVDTNAKRFKSGMITDAEFFGRVCADNLKFLVSAPMSYFEPQRMAKDPFIQQHFVFEKQFVDPDLKHFMEFPIVIYKSTGTCR